MALIKALWLSLVTDLALLLAW